MILLLALVLSGPLPAHRCASACLERGPVWQCFYDVQRACEPGQFDCPVRADVLCVPRVVSLGTWSPVPVDYRAPGFGDFAAGSLNVPGPFGEYPTEKTP